MKWKLVVIFTVIAQWTAAQNRYYTKTGQISFYSDAPMEKIEAVNRSVSAVLDKSTGQLQFLVLMKGFEFKKALMQEHFNENYVESDRYPKAQFRGMVVNNPAINYEREGSYVAVVKGKLSLHGKEQDVETKGTISVKNGKLGCEAVFVIRLNDFEVKIPALVKDKVAERVTITVSCSLEPLQ